MPLKTIFLEAGIKLTYLHPKKRLQTILEALQTILASLPPVETDNDVNNLRKTHSHKEGIEILLNIYLRYILKFYSIYRIKNIYILT